MSWYYERQGDRAGPVSEEELRSLVQAGSVTPETLVWQSGMTDWQPYAQALAAAAEPEDETCSQCGNAFGRDQLIRLENRWVCGDCKPLFVQRMKEGAALPGRLSYAGFWIRFAARLIDSVLLFVVNLIFYLPALVVAGLQGETPEQPPSAWLVVTSCLVPILQLAASATYESWMVGRYGATLGKMALKLKVVRPDGSAVAYGRATGRYFATMLSGITLMIGYIMAAFDDEKRALHDHVCDTRVVVA